MVYTVLCFSLGKPCLLSHTFKDGSCAVEQQSYQSTTEDISPGAEARVMHIWLNLNLTKIFVVYF